VACPYCSSDDVRHSHTSFGLERFGFRRYRCRVCRERFWRGPGRHETVKPRRHEGHEEAPGDADAVPPEAEPVPDLSALDEELARRRSGTLPH
jgi:hypothetical protein